MPFAGFDNFDACVLGVTAKGHSEEEARHICGKLQADAEQHMSENFNNQWIEIFKTGNYGDKGTFTPAELDQIVANFDPKSWQPVLTPPVAQVGHGDAAPALGLVSALRRDGESLLAQFEKVHPKLEESVRDGRFPNRSVGLYSNPKGKGWLLRHVAFLGAVPPEVKGLARIQFSDGEFIAIDFNEEDTVDPKELSKTVGTEIRNFFSLLFGEKRTEPVTFTEEDRKKLIEDAQKPFLEELKGLTKKFDESAKAAQTAAAATTETAKKAEVRAFIETQRARGAWVPAFDVLIPVLEQAAISGATVKFTEGAGEKAKTIELSSFEAFRKFFEAQAAIVPLGELAKAGRKLGKLIRFTEPTDPHLTVDAESLALAESAQRRAEELRKAEPKMAFHEAYAQALLELRREGVQQPGGIAAGQA